jgi:hypothetical protein
MQPRARLCLFTYYHRSSPLFTPPSHQRTIVAARLVWVYFVAVTIYTSWGYQAFLVLAPSITGAVVIRRERALRSLITFTMYPFHALWFRSFDSTLTNKVNLAARPRTRRRGSCRTAWVASKGPGRRACYGEESSCRSPLYHPQIKRSAQLLIFCIGLW